jgi:hypothetical protein
MKMFAMRNRKTQRFFRFELYCDDGWGMYEDNVSIFDPDDLPSFFTEHEFEHRDLQGMVKAEPDDIEWVEFALIQTDAPTRPFKVKE